MIEIELKILEIDRNTIEEKLTALGAEKVFDDMIHAVYYDTPDHSLKAGKHTFRLRKEGPNTVLAFKRFIENSGAKIRAEEEVIVSDFNTMRSILETIGFTPWLEMKKHRTSYVYEDIHCELDKYHEEYAYIPEFLEVEGPGLEAIYSFIQLLGFSKKDCRAWDSFQVAEYYSRLR
jgi:predicted adenylyl cyclase CyaB